MEHSLQNAACGQAVDTDIANMSRAEGGGEGTPFTAIFTDRDEYVKEAVVIDFYSSSLYGEETGDFFRCSGDIFIV
jgi:hypothetical protein